MIRNRLHYLGGAAITLALASPVAAYNFCDMQDPTGEIMWDIRDNGEATIPFTLTAGDAWTQVKQVNSASIQGLHQYAGDIAASLLSPSGTEVILFRLGDGRYNNGTSACSRADFDLTFTDNSPNGDLSVATEGNFCGSGNAYRNRTPEPVWAQPYLPNFPSVPGLAALTGNPKTYSSEGLTGNLLSNFVGDSAVGTWGLKVVDVFPQDVGTLQRACVDMDFGSVTYDMWVSRDANCADQVDNGQFDYGENVYVCYVASNEATEDFTFTSESNNHGVDLGPDFAGNYSAKYGGNATVKTTVRSFVAGVDAELPADQTTLFTGSIVVNGADTYFTPTESLTTFEAVAIAVGPPPEIVAHDDTPSAINGADGGNFNVLEDDSRNGVLNPDTVNDVVVKSSGVATDNTPLGLNTAPDNGGITLDPLTGLVTVAPGTTAGTYTYTYEVCDKAFPTFCDTATAIVNVDPAPLEAADDTLPPVNGVDGGSTPSVVANDTLNGNANPTVGTDVTFNGSGTAQDGTTPLGFSGANPAGVSLDPATGVVTIAPNTPAGTHTYTYEICEVLNPTNCEVAEATIVVDPAPIEAAADNPAEVDGALGGSTPSVFDNDTLNGAVAVPGSVPGTVSVTAPNGTNGLGLQNVPATGGINFDPSTGVITVDPGTPKGTYVYTYEICSNFNTDNCSVGQAFVSVSQPPMTAEDDNPPAIDGSVGGTTTGSVLDNDTLNNIPVDTTKMGQTGGVNLSSSGTAQDGTPLGLATPIPTGGITMGSDGKITVAQGTPAGTYVYTYEICDFVNPTTDCRVAQANVVVSAALIMTGNDAPISPVISATGATMGNVVANDTVGLDTNPTIGTVVTLEGAGIAHDGVTPLGLDQTPTSGGISLNTTTGEITIEPGTPMGTYTYTYEICEVLNPNVCAIGQATIPVDPTPLAANPDALSAVNGETGGTVTPSVIANDTLNGAPNPEIGDDVTLKGEGTAQNGTPLGLDNEPAFGGITFDPNTGNITVKPHTPAGTYIYTYEICEVLNPTNCAIGQATITVDPAPIEANDDTPPAINGSDGGTTPSVLANDRENGILNPQVGYDVFVNGQGPSTDGTKVLGLDQTPEFGAITFDPNTGEITVAPGTTAGTYTYTYEVCEFINPDVCEVADATIVVDAASVDATADTPPPVNGASGGTIPNVVANDILNGNPNPTIGDDVTVKGTGTAQDGTTALGLDNVPASGGITLDPATGEITVAPGTPAGTYTYTYEICEVINPTNCAIGQATVVVDPAPIAANPDTPPIIDGEAGGSTPNVVANDTLNGNVNPTIGDDVTLNVSGTAQNGSSLGLDNVPATGGITLDPATGVITVAPGTEVGNYTYTYEICEVLNPTNCSTAAVSLSLIPGDYLITEIESDLGFILREDLVSALAMQSKQIGGYSADALDRLRSRSHNSCLADVNAHLAKENILFDTDRATIKAESDHVLDEIATILNSCSGSAFEIAGHTDSDASDAYNVDLSQRRVTAVLNALATRGVNTTGYVARGYGESQPIASNASAEGKAQNRRVEFRPLNNADYAGPCEDSSTLVRSLNANANEKGASADGQFVSDRHDCITDRREVFEGSFSYTDTDEGQTQSAMNLSYRREQYKGSDSVFGYFAGMYGTQTDVDGKSNGTIDGLGLNAGIYGAKRLRNTLFVDYYLGAAAGRHSFDLDFQRSIGNINATGDYTYFAGFFGAALSGEVDLGDTTIAPRIGFDYVYAPGTDADVLARTGALSQTGIVKIDAISGGRAFAEIRTDYLVNDGQSKMWINPRVACYQSLGSLNGVCGVGGAIGIESIGDGTNGLTYAFEIDGELGENYTQGKVTLSAERDLDVGTVSTDVSMSADGKVNVGGEYRVNF